ncbi:hypothetical protein NA78x_004015 [Anatilimnocola sp. NA78]|uniref:hypothetical protein n=1 Tax=Anatilimnocola sp. NA78 TaxID=3415683 RepID=UPI003CE5938A
MSQTGAIGKRAVTTKSTLANIHQRESPLSRLKMTFSIRALLLLMVVAALVAFCISERLRFHRDLLSAERELKENGCSLELYEQSSLEFPSWIGLPTAHPALARIDCGAMSDFRAIEELRSLRTVIVDCKGGACNAMMPRSTSAQYIFLKELPPSAVESMRGWRNVRRIALSREQVDVDFARELVSIFSGIEELDCSRTKMDDNVALCLLRLPILHSFDVSLTQVSDAIIEKLIASTRLRRVDLSGSLVSSTCVDRLRQLRPELEVVHTSNGDWQLENDFLIAE